MYEPSPAKWLYFITVDSTLFLSALANVASSLEAIVYAINVCSRKNIPPKF